MYISTPNVNPVSIKIIELGGNTIIATVSKTNPYSDLYDTIVIVTSGFLTKENIILATSFSTTSLSI
jgi:hypothetical protein